MANTASVKRRLSPGDNIVTGELETLNQAEMLAPYRVHLQAVRMLFEGKLARSMREPMVAADGASSPPSAITRERYFTIAKGALGAGGLTVLGLGAFAPHLSGLAIGSIAGVVTALGAVIGCFVVGR